ncbi:MAG: protein-(glutamine-N5) methyltransferase, release factor-specific [Candidatus Marinimicrobia bacterium]|nr:protein-(glutamine-N5) methyltransferase, release factor-specific [Candidatus Neomarinimicrobiota bacterium]|tara:strand:- start:2256 stop:3110 length:855 start_codon:yes stop_codon:yes gene_type:complete
MSKIWRVIDIIDWAESYFYKKNFNNPRLEIEWFLRSILNCSKLDIYLRFEEPLTQSQLIILKQWVKRRVKHEPLQYITGTCEFYGREFKISSKVLIPRQETERLVDIVIKKIKNIDNPTILDIGTGSGCIASTLALERSDSNILGIDISSDAINIAEKNKSIFSLNNVYFRNMDILNELPLKKFDIIVSNPPYVSIKEMTYLMQEVRDYEPKIALTDFNNGLMFYKRIAKISREILKPGSWIILEVGLNEHSDKVKSIFNDMDYNNLDLIKDYNGDDRVFIAKV